MNTIAYILLLVITLIAGLSPILKKVFDQLNTNVYHKQFELLRKLVEEAVSYVNQMSLIEEMSPEEKKKLAIKTAGALANTFGLPEDRQSAINDLIESVLWKTEEEAPSDDADDFDD
jgi:mannosyltransferase OCH1-like enzyme